jgi:hypothetical protein
MFRQPEVLATWTRVMKFSTMLILCLTLLVMTPAAQTSGNADPLVRGGPPISQKEQSTQQQAR